MPLTPHDVHNVTFSKPSIGKRGYAEDEVDAFLDVVATELIRLTTENNDLHKRIDQLIQQLRTAQADAADHRRPLAPAPTEDQHGQAAKVLGMAQEIADRLTRDARAEAERMASQSRATNHQLLAETRTKADSMINEARGRAASLVDEAQARAVTLDRQAQEKATALEREAVRKHDETLGAIVREKDVLERKVEELRTFEREYRTRLQTYLNAQLRELDNRASAAPAETIPSQRSYTGSGFDAHADPKTTVLLRNAG